MDSGFGQVIQPARPPGNRRPIAWAPASDDHAIGFGLDADETV